MQEKNVPLQHVPYFDVQNTDERHSFVKHFYSGFLLFSLNNFNFLHQDFMFQLNDEEYENLRCKNSTSSWSGRRYNPYAFIVSLQKNTMKLKSSAVIWQGVIRKKQGVVIPWQGVKIKKQGVIGEKAVSKEEFLSLCCLLFTGYKSL